MVAEDHHLATGGLFPGVSYEGPGAGPCWGVQGAKPLEKFQEISLFLGILDILGYVYFRYSLKQS